jgi:transcriptional regulator with XRE-family HTH domain
MILANLHKRGGVSVNRAKELRQRAGMQQKEVAVAIGVSRPTVSEWEHQKKDPSGDRLLKLAELFDVSTGVILGLEPMPGNESQDMTVNDNEIWELREQVRRDPERHYLFSLAKDADIEDVRQAVAIIDALKKTRG